jgi:uncharacterized protein (DUF342 family)
MPATAREPAIRVAVAADKSSAELLIPPGLDRRMVTAEVCEALLRQAGVEITAAVESAVRTLVDTDEQTLRPGKYVVARATQPIHGVDGYVEWTAVPEAPPPCPTSPDGEPATRSYYDLSAFVIVRPGEVIGTWHRPTAGEDGRDVTGKTLTARTGKEFQLTLDESIMLDATGKLIAQDEGVLVRDDHQASIRRVLEVPEYVDFSTGNIDFKGDVIVGKGVRDLFTVKATGNIEVKGLIEAATILCDGDLFARGGFAGRERGTARCGGVQAKYLDNIQGEVLRDLAVEREIINCDITVHGNLAAPHGAIIGGRMVITGTIQVGMLGSGAGVATELVVGSVPRLEGVCRRLREFVNKLEDKHKLLLSDQEHLTRLLGKRPPTPTDKERQTELIFEIANVQTLLNKARPTLERLEQRIAEQRTVDVTVERKLHPGVVIAVGGERYHIASELKGPVRIRRDRSGTISYSRGEQPAGPLVQIADVEIAGAEPNKPRKK